MWPWSVAAGAFSYTTTLLIKKFKNWALKGSKRPEISENITFSKVDKSALLLFQKLKSFLMSTIKLYFQHKVLENNV